MKLIRLSANHESFKEVLFEKKGINIICAKKNNPDKSFKSKTLNGLGKTLLLNIVNFCLGSDKIQAFEDKIPQWIFTLEFEINGEIFNAKRSTTDQALVVLNDEELSVTKFRNLLEEKLFEIPEEAKYLTFRSLISRFLRVRKETCVDWDYFNKNETDYQKLLYPSFLLGIDPLLLQKKKEIRDEYTKLDESRIRIQKDPILKKYFNTSESIDIDMTDYEEKIAALQKNVDQFKIANDYREIENEADSLARHQKKLNNKINLFENKLKSIKEALKMKFQSDSSRVTKMYERASIEVPELLKRKMDVVLEFHKKIVDSRAKRLLSEESRLQAELDLHKVEVTEIDSKLDNKLKYLGDHGALDEFTIMNRKLSDLKSELDNLKRYQKLIDQYDEDITKKEIEINERYNIAKQYLSDHETMIKENNAIFRRLSKRFYPEHPGGISIAVNKGNNQTQFDIAVQIDFDTSDGIGEAKILCFDLTMLLLQRNHSVKCIFHDSRLFSDMDPRQVASFLEVLDELSSSYDFQYIMSVNQNTIDSIKQAQYMDDTKYKRVIEDNIILTLTDESPESKLLGIEINMDYEK